MSFNKSKKPCVCVQVEVILIFMRASNDGTSFALTAHEAVRLALSDSSSPHRALHVAHDRYTMWMSVAPIRMKGEPFFLALSSQLPSLGSALRGT